MNRIILKLIIALLVFPLLVSAEDYDITGYFTHVYAREHVTDMPRGFFMLIEADGTITPMYFHRYSSKNKGELGKWTFDPRDFLGKTIRMDFEGKPEENNNEYNVWEGNTLKKIKKVSVEIINSLTIVNQQISVDEMYQYPQTDTLLFPHDELVEIDEYADKTPTKKITLTDYVQGAGTQASPYTSSDGYAGLKAACAALPDGGTIEVPTGIYKATNRQLSIPRFVSIKGVGAQKPTFILANDRMWYLKGSNTIDFIDVDMTQIDRSYTHEVICVHHNARDVTIKNSKFIGNYDVDPVTRKETGNVVMFRMFSHIKNITFEADTIIAPLRGIVTKGMRNQHDITIKGCVFKDQAQMSISFDQSSNISNVVVENNQFLEFSHFGIAFARINDVICRNNTFYSRNLESFNTYNQAFHIEEHCQNFVLENNDIDVKLRTAGNDKDPNTKERSPGILVTDSRNFVIKNNRLKHSDILFIGVQSQLIGHSEIFNNTMDDGGFVIRESVRKLNIHDNEIKSPPQHAFYLYSTIPMAYPFGDHTIYSNNITGIEGAQAMYLRGEIRGLNVTNNTFRGCTQNPSTINVYENSERFHFQDNTFFGRTANNTFEVEETLPSSVSLSGILANNKYYVDCNATSVNEIELEEKIHFYPNPVKVGDRVKLNSENRAVSYTLSTLNGARVIEGQESQINTSTLKPGVYFLHISNGQKTEGSKLVVL